MWYIFSLVVFYHESLLHTDIRIRYRRNIYCQMKWMHLIQYLIFLKYVWNSRIHKKWMNNFFLTMKKKEGIEISTANEILEICLVSILLCKKLYHVRGFSIWLLFQIHLFLQKYNFLSLELLSQGYRDGQYCNT